MKSAFWSKLRLAALSALRSAAITTVMVFVVTLVRAGLTVAFSRNQRIDWRVVVGMSITLGLVLFVFVFVYLLIKLFLFAPAEEILDQVDASEGGYEMSGFVAMQYYALILNRTFLVFICPDGVYGWKVEGPVAANNPRYFEPYKEMLKDRQLMRSPTSVHKLAKLRGGFYISLSSMVSVDFDPHPKWGMSQIPHSGRIEIRQASGKRTELILLGSVDGERLREAILQGRNVHALV